MSVLRLVIACLLVLAAVNTAAAQTPARHALLIGNQSYTREVGTLKNPINDVALIAGALEKIGFKRENIRRVTDADRITILREIDAYGDRLAAAGADAVGFFYYSGHGVANERDQRNYLIPIEVKQLDSAVWYSGVPLDDIIAKLAAQAREASQFVLFDACRNVLNVPSRGSKGFVPIASRRGMLIGFSTDPGQTASDAGATSGPYAAALAAELVKPGQHHLDLFQNVKEQVFKTTKAQVPWERNGLLSRVYLGGTAVAAAAPVVSSPAAAEPPLSEAAQAWAVTKDTTSVAVLEAFAKRYPETVFADLARARVGELKVQWQAKAEAERALAALERKTASLSKQQPTPRPTPASRDASLSVGETFRDCYSNDPVENRRCPEMVVLPAGSFMMGSNESDDEKPVRKVTIAKPIAVGKFEVTFAEWDACVAGGGCAHKPETSWGRGRQPAINVSWDDAKQYVAWLAKATGKDYRLLSEAEWEYVARAGTTTRYAFGDTITKKQAQFSESEWGSAKQTVAVGSFAANAFGLHDMHGNVWEWVEDCWNGDYKGAPGDGAARTGGDCSQHVLRGGSWSFTPGFLRSAGRIKSRSANRDSNNGFRVARVLSR